ncbi:XrtX-associated membrane protein [Hymenobacter norwichensis]|uniref:XrtX-associated membrane protein n=1 Tax=Hymenobacter norwichensis TaxID=223903 RepID=UPI0012F7A988|nr:hypothetical protein [Hymenobacter norwichensis]
MPPLSASSIDRSWLWRGAGSVALVALLLVATLSNEAVYSVLGNFWQQIFELLGIKQTAAAPAAETSVGTVLNRPRNLPAVLSYGALYVLACLTLLFLLLPHGRQRRLVLGFYAIAGTAFVVLIGISRLGNAAVLAVLANQLLHFIVSPVPVIMLVPLLRWYWHNQPATKPMS